MILCISSIIVVHEGSHIGSLLVQALLTAEFMRLDKEDVEAVHKMHTARKMGGGGMICV